MAKPNGWLRRFDDAINTPDGRKLMTLRDAIQHLGDTVPKREHDHPKVGLSRAAKAARWWRAKIG